MSSTSNDSKGEEEEYTTSYTKMLLQQNPNYRYHYFNSGISSNNRQNSSYFDVLFAGEGAKKSTERVQENYYTGSSSGRKRLGVRLIQQRWRNGGLSREHDDRAANNKDSEVSDGLLSYSEEERGADYTTNICHDDDDDDDKRQQQKRWRKRRANNSFSSSSDITTTSSPPSNNITSNFGTSAATAKNNHHAAATSSEELSVQPLLLFRRRNSNLYYSNERQYTNIHFLNSAQSVVIGVDNYGDLDIVRVPSSSFAASGATVGGGGRYCTTNDHHGGGGGGANNNNDQDESRRSRSRGGIGTLQADRMQLCNNNHDGGPRYPMDNFHCELFGYENGTKFAVGLRSGRVQLFTTEHAAASAAAAASENCLNERENAPTCTSLGSTNALWSCLPSTSTTTTTFGPQRRYHKSDKYPLSTMLSSSTITQKTSLFDAYNTSFLEEISDWDKTNNETPNHRRLLQGDGCPWAFREGGCGSLSGTALMGACIDADNGDCFSLRVMDERLQQSNGSASASNTASAMNVVVVDDRNAASIKPTNCRERVDSVCFSGEYGLVTSHSITLNENEDHCNVWPDDYTSHTTATCIKWWDHRMLRSHQPANTMCLSFPRDNVSLMSPDVERCLAGLFCDSLPNSCSWTNQGHTACTPSSLREFSTEQPLDRTHFGLYQVNRLVGARDSSDRLAIHMKGCCSHAHHYQHDEVFMIDSCQGEITQHIRNEHVGELSLCISSYLDTMAWYTTEAGLNQRISIYDVSRQRSDVTVATSRHEHDPFKYLSGKKRLLEVSDDKEDMFDEGLLRTLLPEVLDRYGIDSSISCMAIDDYGAAIACGTSDGDMYLLNSSDLDELATEKHNGLLF